MEEARENFEEQWRDAFEHEEIAPPAHVWNSIDAVMASTREEGYKKKILFFKWVAAASVIIAVTSGLFVWRSNQHYFEYISEKKTIEENKQSISDSIGKDEQILATTRQKLENSPLNKGIDSKTSINARTRSNSNDQLDNNWNQSFTNGSRGNTFLAIVDTDRDANDAHDLTYVSGLMNEEELFVLNRISGQKHGLETVMVPLKMEFLYAVPNLAAAWKKDKNREFNMWAGVSFSSGSFDPGTVSSSGSNALASQDALEFSQDGFNATSTRQGSVPSEIGSSYSAGLDVGGMVAEKVIISSGIHYLNVTSNTTSDLFVTDPNSNESRALFVNNLNDASIRSAVRDGSLVVSKGNAQFQNQFNYLTIPIKAGYILYDRKINLILNSGITTNFLINNQLQSSSGDVLLFDNNTNDGAYRSVYFNMLTSIEIGYRLKDKYYISLEPNYRRALSNFTTEDSGFNGKPTNVGLSVGMKYIF